MALKSTSTDLDVAASLEAANTTFLTLLEEIFKPDAASSVDLIADKITTNSEVTQFDVLGDYRFRKWVGPRYEKSLRAYKFDIKLDTYEATMSERRKAVQYDNTGLFARKVSEWLAQEKFMDARFAMDTLLANSNCFDGTALAGASHVHAADEATWSNNSTNAMNRANLQAMDEAVAAWTLENGEYSDSFMDTVLCGPKNADTARRLLEADELIGAYDHQGKPVVEAGYPTTMANVYQGSKRLVIDKRISGSTYQYYWFGIDSSKPAPVLIVEGQGGVVPAILDKPEDHNVFHTDRYIWGLRRDVAYGNANPRAIYRNAATAGGF